MTPTAGTHTRLENIRYAPGSAQFAAVYPNRDPNPLRLAADPRKIQHVLPA